MRTGGSLSRECRVVVVVGGGGWKGRREREKHRCGGLEPPTPERCSGYITAKQEAAIRKKGNE